MIWVSANKFWLRERNQPQNDVCAWLILISFVLQNRSFLLVFRAGQISSNFVPRYSTRTRIICSYPNSNFFILCPYIFLPNVSKVKNKNKFLFVPIEVTVSTKLQSLTHRSTCLRPILSNSLNYQFSSPFELLDPHNLTPLPPPLLAMSAKCFKIDKLNNFYL